MQAKLPQPCRNDAQDAPVNLNSHNNIFDYFLVCMMRMTIYSKHTYEYLIYPHPQPLVFQIEYDRIRIDAVLIYNTSKFPIRELYKAAGLQALSHLFELSL